MLEELNFYERISLKEIPEGFGDMTSPKKLDVRECEALEAFPIGLSNLSTSEDLRISRCRSMKGILEVLVA